MLNKSNAEYLTVMLIFWECESLSQGRFSKQRRCRLPSQASFIPQGEELLH